MKIISYNVNGIRAAMQKGFVDWLKTEMPDVLHVQEVKAMIEQVDISQFIELGYSIEWFSAQKKGYSGVATFTKFKPTRTQIGIGNDFFDAEGRFLLTEYNDVIFINSYFPSGTTGDIRQEKKEEYLELVFDFCVPLLEQNKKVILSGDFNICHKPIDINHPKKHEGYSGFLPQEREWMDRMVNLGFVDTFRMFNTEPNNYSWWSYRAGSRAKNLGWRIDYTMCSQNISEKVTAASILPQVVHSDHCPVVMVLE